MDTNQLTIYACKLDHSTMTPRDSGQDDLDFIADAVAATDVEGCDVVTCNVNDPGSEEPPTAPTPVWVTIQRAPGQSDSSFEGDISSAIKTAAGL